MEIAEKSARTYWESTRKLLEKNTVDESESAFLSAYFQKWVAVLDAHFEKKNLSYTYLCASSDGG